MASIIKKISVKTVFGDIKTAMKKGQLKSGDRVLRVIGIAQSVKEGESQYGEWQALMGQFKGTNLVTGEAFSAGKCFLPGSAMELIVPVVQSGQPAEFAVDIAVNEADNAVGYEYVVIPLVQQQATDAMERLESLVEEAAALPAPKKGAKK